MRDRKPLLLLGAGSIATNYAEAFRDDANFRIEGFVEDRDPSAAAMTIEGLPVYRTEDALRMARTHAVICCIGSPARRTLVERFEAAGFEFATLISPAAIIHPKAIIEPGCVVSDQTDVDPHTRIGRHSILSAKVSFGHHTTMGPYGFIGPGTMIAGSCTIGEGCYLGMSAAIRDHIEIGDGATIGAGAVVVKDVAPGTTVVGNPARPLVRSGDPPAQNPPRKPLLLLGAGGMAATYAVEFKDGPRFEIAGFVQDADAALNGTLLHGKPICGVEEALGLARTHAVIGAIGSPDRRRLIERFESAGFEFPTLISPTAIVHAQEGIGPGCIVSDLANLDPYIRVGRHTIVTSRVTIGHHSTVGEYGFLAPGVMIGGECRIGARCFIGMGAIVRDHITIGDGATVGAGAVVVRNVEPGATVAGVPARPLAGRQEKARKSGDRRPLLVLGAGEQAAAWTRKLAADIPHDIAGYVQSIDPSGRREQLEGRPVYWIDDALKFAESHVAICMIGTPARSELVERFAAAGFEFISVVSHLALVTPDVKLGPGCVVTEFATIEPFCEIGSHTEVLHGALIGHHSRIGSNCIICAGAIIAGGVRMGDRCFVGIGARIRDHVSIGEGATVGAGAVVVGDVAAGTTVVGNPARPLERREAGKFDPGSGRQPVLILGAGEQAASHAENVADHPDYEIVGFVQDVDPERRVREIEGRPVYHMDDVKDWHSTHKVVCCIGSTGKREVIRRFEALGFEFVTLVATSALISPKADLGPGCFVSHTGQVASYARVGAHTMIGRQTMIGHHSTVGPFSLIAGSSVIGGGARIGEGCFIGMGALIRDHITLGDNVTVGVGAVVVKDVPSGATVAGVPARPVGEEAAAVHICPARQPVLFLGAGSMAEHSAQIFRNDPHFELAGFVQDADPGRNAGALAGKPVYWIEDALKLRDTHAVIACIGSTRKREMVERFEAARFRFATMIAPSARVDRLAEVGPGCLITQDASIDPHAKIGAHTLVMRRAVFGHHSSIGPYGTIAAGSLIAGSVRIGESCFIGIGSILNDHITLGDRVTVGAGAVVVNDVPSGTTVVGNPARPISPKPRETKESPKP